ncbi:MAG TPA: hypothetical protein VMU22_00750 [Rhizomicrobium sp.]|nr:hypothetical protein [Rhizomicrobium sp.]
MTDDPKRPAPEKDTEECLDDALDDSFPASDPPSHSNPARGTKTDQEALKEQAKDNP